MLFSFGWLWVDIIRNGSIKLLIAINVCQFHHFAYVSIIFQGTYVEGIKEEVVLSPGHVLSFIAAGEGAFWGSFCSFPAFFLPIFFYPCYMK